MRQHYPEVQAAGGDVIAIGFAPINQLRTQTDELDLPFPFLHDPGLAAYAALGFGRGSWWQVYGPSTLWTYTKLLLRGRRLRPATVDRSQLGGDVVIDADGKIAFAHASRTPADRPRVAQLIAALRGGTGAAA